MPVGNVNFNTLLTTTLNNHQPNLVDNLSTNIALYWKLKEKGAIKKLSGGAKIVIPLLYGKNSTSSSYSGYDALSLTPQDGITAAEFNWKNHNVSVALSGEEERKNNGPAEVVDLWGAKVKQAEITCAEDFSVMFHSTGAGNAGKNFLGIEALIGDNLSTVTTVGGIDSTDALNTWWRSYVERTVGVLTLQDIGTAYYQASRGPTAPDFGVTSLALYQKFEALLQPQQRFTDPKMASAGFENLKFHGAPVCWDAGVTAGRFFWLNTEFLKLVQHTDAWMSPTPVDKPSGIDARYSHIISMGELTISNRKHGGSKLEGRTA